MNELFDNLPRVERPKTGMGSHERTREGETNEWLTPPELVEFLGPFDLDPCSPVNRPWDTAKRHLTVDDDGLRCDWAADELVWLNPPYGPHSARWLRRLADHPGGGIALIFARTETRAFVHYVWRKATAVLFVEGRIKFHNGAGVKIRSSNSGAPSCLVAYGTVAYGRLCAANEWAVPGTLVTRWQTTREFTMLDEPPGVDRSLF